jgi:polyketide cyclase/dehydrase/lipid transport protein
MSLLTFTKRSSLLFRCDSALLYDVLTDYDTFSEWFPLVARSKLLAREGDLAIAEFELLQPAKDMFVVECIHTKNKMVLWRTIRGRIPINEVRWDIEPGGAGQSPGGAGQCKVTLSIEGRTCWARLVPAYRLFLKTARDLQALQNQVSAFLPDLETTEGEKILEISETGEGLVCWMNGKKYTLTPAPEGSHD